MTLRHNYIDANGVRFHYAEQGEGPLALLLHGFPECWYSWRHQLPALADAGFRAVAPDMRGYNLTSKPRSGYNIETLVADVIALGRALGGRDARVHLAGHDWGGIVAWQTAWRAPAYVETLTILNAPHPAAFARHLLRSPLQMLRSSYVLAFQVPWLSEWLLTANDAEAVAWAFRLNASRPDRISSADLDVYRRAMLQPGAARAALNYYREALRQGTQVLPTTPIETPTLVLWGRDDPVLPPGHLPGMRPWVKDLTIREISDCGHWTQQEAPDVVCSEMLGWLGHASGTPAATPHL